jgi:DNA-binding winged helix-turn-helix (wHTH) protein
LLAITYRFGAFMLDARHRVLYLGTQERPLTEKLFRVLAVLLEADGRTVPKEAFIRRVWSEGGATEANLTQHIFMLRGLLGESARDHAYIVTVAGRGYRLAVPVEQKLGLAMRQTCERCQLVLDSEADAMICSYECTFCSRCAAGMSCVCPNCGGELVARPRRRAPAPAAAAEG